MLISRVVRVVDEIADLLQEQAICGE